MSDTKPIVEYREIPGFPGYRIGNDGSVWSRRGSAWIRLKLQPGYRGYLRVTLYNGRPRRFLVHRLVLLIFVGPCPKGMECRHFPDGATANNSLSNLQWGTRKQNIADQAVMGTRVQGERQGLAVLNAQIVKDIRADHAGGMGCKRLARKYGHNSSTICSVTARRTWKHVT